MKKIIKFSVVLILTFLIGCATSSKAVYVKLSPKILTFGTVYVGSTSSLKFKIINNTIKEYDITNVQIIGQNSSEFSILSGWSGTITVQANTEFEISIEFAPIEVGSKDASIEISHTYPSEVSPRTLSIIANSKIDSMIESDPIKHHYGFIPIGNSDTKDFTLKNTGNSSLEIKNIMLSGAGASDYSITAGWNGNPVNVPVASELVVTVKFSPNSDGDKIAKLKIEHNGSNSPVYVNLSGGGGYGYIVETFPVGLTSIRNSGIQIRNVSYLDDEWYNYNLGFTFKYFGQSYTNIWICDNGWVCFGQDPFTPAYDNFTLPCAGAPDAAIYPFWDDVELNKANVPEAKWVYEIQDSSPNQVFVIEWYRLNRYNSAPPMVATYQLRLYETTNVIEFHYSTIPEDWSNSSWSATIGLEDENADKNYEISGSPMINHHPTVNYRFIP